VGPRAVLEGGKSRPHWDSIPDRPARSSVAIPTELHRPHMTYIRTHINQNTPMLTAALIIQIHKHTSAASFQT